MLCLRGGEKKKPKERGKKISKSCGEAHGARQFSRHRPFALNSKLLGENYKNANF